MKTFSIDFHKRKELNNKKILIALMTLAVCFSTGISHISVTTSTENPNTSTNIENRVSKKKAKELVNKVRNGEVLDLMNPKYTNIELQSQYI